MAAKNTPGFWGALWLDHVEAALQTEAGGSQNVRLSKGKNYKRRRHIQNIEVSPGSIRADVVDHHSYSAQLGTELLDEASLEAMIDEVAGSGPLVVALLSGEVPQELAAFLFDDRGFVFDCNCPSAAVTCKHGADFCWAVADLFDADPFMLLLFCGQDRDGLLSKIRNKRSPEAATQTLVSDLPRGADPGISASKAYKKEPVAISEFKRLPRKPGSLATLFVTPPQDSGIEESGLQNLVSDAAARAHSLVSGASSSFMHLNEEFDFVRRFAAGTVPSKLLPGQYETEIELLNLAQAWRYGQEAGLKVTLEVWQAPTSALTPGVNALETTFSGTARTYSNCVHIGKTQLRIDQDAQWWRFAADDQLGWVLSSIGVKDPVELLD